MKERAEDHIIQRAVHDRIFRKELKKNPKKVMEMELGRSLPKGVKIEIIEKENNKWYLLLPPFSDKL
jgi:hypothetical protein